MLRDRRNERNDFRIRCPQCEGFSEDLNPSGRSFEMSRCEFCYKTQIRFKCNQATCGFVGLICPNCSAKSLAHKKSKKNEVPRKLQDISVKEKGLKEKWDLNWKLVFIVFLLGIIIYWFFLKNPEEISENNMINVEKLKKYYPSQTNETWYHILGVLENEIASVKSIIFLHGKDTRTTNCLINELVILFTKNRNLKNEDITFTDFEAEDYGFVLEHYYTVVKKYKVFITDLNKISGNVARIFHTLCDDVSSDIKPSLFIFTLQRNEKIKTSKIIEIATSILMKIWSDLAENELSPLLSRVVKNVVDIVPEHQEHFKCEIIAYL